MITVPTKQHDGASDGASIANFVAGLTPNNVDAFAKYSSNLVRMKALLLLDEDENDDENLDYLGSLNDALRHASADDHDARKSWQRSEATKGQGLVPHQTARCPPTQDKIII